MEHRQDLPPALRRMIAAQRGLVTVEQAALLGVGNEALRRLVDQGHWKRPIKGLYDAAPLVEGLEKTAWAAVLLGRPGAAIGGEAALRLYGVGIEPELVEVWVRPDTQPVAIRGVRVRRDFLERTSHRQGQPPRIRVEDALIDVGQFLPTGRLVGLLSDAVRNRLTSPRAVGAVIKTRARVRGRRRIEALLADLDGIESTLEYVYRRDVERAHGLPPAHRQASVSTGTRSDGLYEAYGVVIELDGRAFHQNAGAAFRDLARDNAHAELNLITLRYGSADVRGRPCTVADQVAAVLRTRGWAGITRRCPRCSSP